MARSQHVEVDPASCFETSPIWCSYVAFMVRAGLQSVSRLFATRELGALT